MRFVRDRAEARWLPSRFRYALFRLLAFVKLRNAKPEPAPGLLLMIDRDQNALESMSMAVWIVATMTAFVTYELDRVLPLGVAIVPAFFVALLLIEIPIHPIGLSLPRGRMNVDTQTWCNLALIAAAAAWYASRPAWVRFAGWQFLFFLLLNGAASLVVLPLRSRIAALEATYGGESSGV